MTTDSVWKTSGTSSSFPSLSSDLKVDVAIIGGGITGINAAYLLSQAGKKVAVIEARKVGDGSTGYSTGNLYSLVGGEGLHSIQSKWSEEVAQQVIASRELAVDFIENRVKEFDINCDFKRIPWCLFTNIEDQQKFIDKEREAIEKAGVNVSDGIPFPLPYTAGFRVEGQAQFNPYVYVVELAKKIQSEKCMIFENTSLTDLEEDEVCTVKTTGGTITADYVIMATHTPKGFHKVQAALTARRECAVAVKLNGEYPLPGTFWYRLEKEHYSLRTYDTPAGPVLMLLGQTYEVGHQEKHKDRFDRLESFLRQHFDVSSVVFKWAAQNYKSADHLPFIGLSAGKKKTFLATGFAADGLVYGTVAALVIFDQIMGDENPYSKTYDASRITLFASAKEYIKQTVTVATQYLKDIPGIVEAKDADEIPVGDGRVIQSGGEKIAAYRDEENNLHLCSAVCTHMDCIVDFNKEEKSWDCPCHGSRFSFDGKVIEGPAIFDLPKRNLKKD